MLDIQKIEAAINMISAEKKIPKEKLVSIIEAAIQTAYKKDYWTKDDKVNVVLNLKEAKLEISLEKVVVKEVKNPSLEISFEELWDDADWFEEWDIVEIDVADDIMWEDWWESFWRIASQAARQVIIQKIWDSEKEKIYDLFSWKQWEAINMKVNLIEWWKVIFDYNWNQVVLPKSEQVVRDNYSAWQRFFVYVAEVDNEDWKNPRVVLSRKREWLVVAIFSQYVSEIWEGIINIDSIVRQPWVKTKMLVSSNYDEIDPVWTLIWQKWMRVKSVMEELSWEKIDIIPNSWSIEDVIKKSLSPANVLKVQLTWEDSAKVIIAKWERAKALWKNWLNVNLASKLLWFNLSIEEAQEEIKDKKEEIPSES